MQESLSSRLFKLDVLLIRPPKLSFNHLNYYLVQVKAKQSESINPEVRLKKESMRVIKIHKKF